jgi:hypothetical protein
MASDSTLANSTPAPTVDELNKTDQVRQALADTYTFVRSREINTTIASFTLDHYISEAMMQIKGSDRQLSDASGQDSLAIGTRPTQLEALASIQDAFNTAFDDAMKLAQKADKASQ